MAGSGITVKVQGTLYPVESLIGKSLYASRDTNLYNGTTKTEFVVPKGKYIGKVDSWIQTTKGIFLMFDTNSSELVYSGKFFTWTNSQTGSKWCTYYVPEDTVADKELQQQGTKTSKQAAEEQKEKDEDKDKSFTDKALETFTGLATKGILAYVGAKVISSLINRGKN